MKNLIALLLMTIQVSVAHGTETDNTTSYYEPLADSESLLNGKMQELISAARARHFGCDRRVLVRQAGAVLVGNLFFGTVESFANTSPLVPRSYTAAADSIYRGTPYPGGIVDTFVNLGPTVNVAGHHVGTDKLGHFIDMGYDLYQRSTFGEPIAALLSQSRREESGLWGLLMTGVKSYGDIASNFDGYRFWKEFAEPGANQYFVCENGSFKQVRMFKWSDYVSSSWSEAINCSEYWSEAYTSHVNGNVRALEEATGRRYACPIAPEQCGLLRNYYEHWIPRENIGEIVSPLCR